MSSRILVGGSCFPGCSFLDHVEIIATMGPRDSVGIFIIILNNLN